MSGEPANSGYGLSGASAAGACAAPLLSYQPPQPRAYRPKIGLIGCGGISEYHLRAYRAMGLEVAALCNRDLAKAAKRRLEFYPEAEIYSDHRELLKRDDIEIVDIAIPAAPRVAVIEAALMAGKHVLSQKPFVLDLAVGERLAALADSRGLRLAVNQNGRWAPHFAYLAAAIDAGVIGPVASIDFTIQWDHTWTAGTSFEEIRHLVLFDFGIHWFDIANRFMHGRKAERVTAGITRTSFQAMKPAMLASAVIDYADAQVRLLFNGHVKHGQEDRTVICGSRGTLRSFGPSLSEQTVELHTTEGRATPLLTGAWFTSGFQGAMAELIRAIEEKRIPTNNARDNLTGLALCYAALASADAGHPVRPDTISTAPGPWNPP